VAFNVLDKDGSGTLSKQEFANFITSETESDRSWFGSLGYRQQHDLSLNSCHGLMKLLFGEKGDRDLHFDEFMGLMKRLKLELLKLEFYQHQIRPQDDSISLKDFAYCMVSCTDLKNLKRLHARILGLPHYEERLGFGQFVEFDKVANRLDKIEEIIYQNSSSINKVGRGTN
jgi:hypothetical protein